MKQKKETKKNTEKEIKPILRLKKQLGKPPTNKFLVLMIKDHILNGKE